MVKDSFPNKQSNFSSAIINQSQTLNFGPCPYFIKVSTQPHFCSTSGRICIKTGHKAKYSDRMIYRSSLRYATPATYKLRQPSHFSTLLCWRHVVRSAPRRFGCHVIAMPIIYHSSILPSNRAASSWRLQLPSIERKNSFSDKLFVEISLARLRTVSNIVS